jgi:hypothetical protein
LPAALNFTAARSSFGPLTLKSYATRLSDESAGIV